RRLVFEATLRLRYSVLLKNGLTMTEHTIAVASRTGERSAWAHGAEAVRDSLRAALNREQEAIDASPYAQEDIERVLAELADRSREERPAQANGPVRQLVGLRWDEGELSGYGMCLTAGPVGSTPAPSAPMGSRPPVSFVRS